jgi:transposase
VSLENKIDQLFAKIDSLNKTVDTLRSENIKLNKRVSALEGENETLKDKLYKKDSKNSFVPPSKDENRIKPNQSLRKKSGRKNGGQKGHKGTTLKMHSHPDSIIMHKPNHCRCCGDPLTTTQDFKGRRQVIDIPQIKPIVTEHQIFSAACSCGHTTIGHYPQEASCPISYGSTLEATINYLSVRQYMPTKRIREHLKQLYGLDLSEGTIINKLKEYAQKCMPFYRQIRDRIEIAHVVGGDETGCVVNGEKHWMWTWQNQKLTYIALSQTRGFKAVTDNYPNGLNNATLVSDCWAAQLKTKSKSHQLCTSHLQRELQYFIELAKEKWSAAFMKLIQQALKLRYKIQSHPFGNFSKEINKVITTSKLLLSKNIIAPKKLLALKKRLIKNEEFLWNFLHDKSVPPDNNGSERAIRNIKVKQKISGQFKSFEGGNQFAIVRSVIDTIIKNESPVYSTMSNIAKFVPE